MTKLMFIVNVDWFFVSHRLPIALKAIRSGYEIHLACRQTDPKIIDRLNHLGIITHNLELDRQSVSLFSNLKTFWQICRILHRVKPSILHLVTIKPVLFGGIASRLLGVKSVVFAISGLGYIYISSGIKATIRRVLIKFCYKVALNRNNVRVIFQNIDDQQILVRLSKISPSITTLVKGSGVDLVEYSHVPIPVTAPLVLMASRLLIDKGVREFIDAVQILKPLYPDARFVIAGDTDSGNPATITASEVAEWKALGCVEVWDYCKNMPKLLSTASIIVLPSYREGLPRILVEAAACGRPVVTTDVAGCRDAICPGKTGFLVEPRNAKMLAKSIKVLLDDPALRAEMGSAGRQFAEHMFNIDDIVDQHMGIYESFA